MVGMLKRLLIANRGEIAVRIIRACRELGIETVAVYSDADARAPHVLAADRAVRIGPAAPRESYLNAEAILDGGARDRRRRDPSRLRLPLRARGLRARLRGAGPHLRRSAVRRHRAHGLEDRRAPADAGGRRAGRARRDAAPISRMPRSSAAAARVGFPVADQGLRRRRRQGHEGRPRAVGRCAEAVAAARREAQAAFGDGTLYVERLVERPRHIEVQVFADAHGHVVHLFERECSVQRRHQKIIEESPSPALTPALRARMGEAAVAAAQAAGYRNAGTVEFLLEGAGDERGSTSSR